jgi:hypothetical protein
MGLLDFLQGNSQPQQEQDGSLALQNTGVPSSVVQQPTRSDQGTNANDVASLISALGGIGLNIAGITSKRGALGNSAIDMSQQQHSQANQVRNEEFQKQTDSFNKEKAQEEAKALRPAANDFYNPTYRDAFLKKLDYYDVAGAQQLLAQDRADRRIDRDSDRKDKDELNQVNRGLGYLYKDLTTQYTEAKKKIKPDVDKYAIIQDVLTSSSKPPETISDLQGRINPELKKAGLPLLGQKEAFELYNDVQKHLDDKTPGIFARTFGGAKAPNSKEAFSDYLASKFQPESVIEHEQAKKDAETAQKRVQSVNQLRQGLYNPKTRPHAMQIAQGVLGSGGTEFDSAPGQQRQTNQVSPEQDERVTVQDKKGNKFTVPQSQLKDAAAQGYTPVK